MPLQISPPGRDSPGPVRSHPELPLDSPDPTQEHRVVCLTAMCLYVQGGHWRMGPPVQMCLYRFVMIIFIDYDHFVAVG